MPDVKCEVSTHRRRKVENIRGVGGGARLRILGGGARLRILEGGARLRILEGQG